MSSPALAIATCPRCSSPLEGGSVEGLCAHCLGALNFDTLTRIGGNDADPLPVPTVEELAEFFPHLEVQSLVGRGGMGVVYKARQKSLHRSVALKLLAPERAGDPLFAERFAREARSLAALNHPHIVSVHDFGEAGGYFYLLMEFVDGVNLRQLIRSRRLTSDEALGIILPVCDALQAAHERGIIHRDVKPENLLIDRSGVVKIADFGIARMLDEPGAESSPQAAGAFSTHTLAAGTPDYAAPEQRASTASDHRADIYSLGVVLYEMLTGERPGLKLVTAPLRRAAVDIRIDDVVLKALQEEPDLRFRTVAEFRERIEQAKEEMNHPAPRRTTVVLFICLVLATVATIGAAMVMGRNPFQPTAAALSPDTPAAVTAPILSLDEAYAHFESNLSELLTAREIELVGQPDGSPVPAGQKEEIRRLEARDKELREMIARLSKHR